MTMTTRFMLLAGLLAISFMAGGAVQGERGASGLQAYLAGIADVYNAPFAVESNAADVLAPVSTASNNPPGGF